MRKKRKMVHVLYDSRKKVYLAKTEQEKHPQVTSKLENAKCFSNRELKKAWRMAYKLSWLDVGKFYVHGIEC